MKMRVKFTQSDNNETTFCTIKYGDEVYTGLAKCHPEDMDFANTLTGQEIAYKRALAAMLKAEIKSTSPSSVVLLSRWFPSKANSRRLLTGITA